MQKPEELAALARRLEGCGEIAVDTEGDSLHHYPDHLALLQIAEDAGTVWLVDPLALPDLTVLAGVFARPDLEVIFHAGENDLGHLKRRHRLVFGRIFDTSIAGRFLGLRQLGLEVLVREFLGLELPPSRQKDDWSARPLTAAQEQYVAADVIHLFALRDRLVEALETIGRRTWVEEECAALAAEPVVEREADPWAWARAGAVRDLPPRTLGILRELRETREQLAVASDRPPFKVLGDPVMVAIAQALPADAESLARVPGCTPRVMGRWGEAILAAVERGRALPDAELPVVPRPPRAPSLSAPARERVERLRTWRTTAAERTGLDPGVLLPNRLITATAVADPRIPDDLGRVEGIRRWRTEAFGGELLAALRARA